jgi:hypothetical protein
MPTMTLVAVRHNSVGKTKWHWEKVTEDDRYLGADVLGLVFLPHGHD